MAKLIALVDCNNFYVSCERVFRPDLIGKPVAVLSNNDGCIVSRSQEVKELGVKMAVPLFQVQHLVKRHHIQLFSSNYALYADMSARVMATLAEFAAHLEVYSIDEAFLDLTDIGSQEPLAYSLQIKETVFKRTGIPVCVGLGPTKTLAKLANFAAKKWPKTGGVLDLSDPIRREKLLRRVAVQEVWGIGSLTAAKLQSLGIHTAWDLASQPSERMHQQFSVVLARTVMELNATPCQALAEIAPDKQQIVCSRSFSRPVTTLAEMSHAVAEYCSRAAEKLRHQKSVAGCLSVYIRTSPFAGQGGQYQRAASYRLQPATQDTRIMISIAQRLLRQIFRAGYNYQKCGVQLSGIQPESTPAQQELFDFTAMGLATENRSLMKTLDQINRRFPKSIEVAASCFDKTWKARSERISPCYTTDWRDLLKVSCC
ncbi:Y-family DNA polymerase [Methylomonas paludis]|uniref:Y-family DNA polymerase n=1 Tax=Methylomonas paludis TaxID=1173101 RepID=A0A975MQ43_9GAMM|nr:Y-family DNA polymerase [Methylomonas paludis]QWF71907.1 Y-family DNA polymerase [Methylomonas paludis]